MRQREIRTILQPKFTGLVVSFFCDYARLAISIFFTNLSRRIDFFKAKKAAENRFVYILYMNLNNVGTSQARIFTKKHFEVSHVKKSKCLGLAKKKASLALSQSLAYKTHIPFPPPPPPVIELSQSKL